MLRSLYAMFDYHLAAKDGVAGRVKDFLFDDESWIIHYLVAETGVGATARNVLIIPFALGFSEWEAKRITASMTCGEIHRSPSIESDMPISLQRESGLKRPGSHLRSMREVLGYRIHATDGEVGAMEDFIIEDMLWGVHHLVISLKCSPGRLVLISPECIRSVSWHGKAAWMNLTRGEIERCAEFDPSKPVNHAADRRLYDYYGRPAIPSEGTQRRPEIEHP